MNSPSGYSWNSAETPEQNQPMEQVQAPISSDASPTGTGSRWDEIRRANSTTQQSSWDVLRQRQEREKLTKAQPGQAPSPPNQSGQLTQAQERAKAQAEFDALLEKERNIGSVMARSHYILFI